MKGRDCHTGRHYARLRQAYSSPRSVLRSVLRNCRDGDRRNSAGRVARKGGALAEQRVAKLTPFRADICGTCGALPVVHLAWGDEHPTSKQRRTCFLGRVEYTL